MRSPTSMPCLDSGAATDRLRSSARWRTVAGILLLTAPFGGCTQAAAPAVPFLGAYFPSWLLCTLAGILAAIVVRVVFVRIGLDDVLPARLVVYLSVAVATGMLVSTLAFGR